MGEIETVISRLFNWVQVDVVMFVCAHMNELGLNLERCFHHTDIIMMLET